jgi:hypothetical protein
MRNLKLFLKCAVGLFSNSFQTETSIGNGMIAITHNGIGLGEVAEPDAK